MPLDRSIGNYFDNTHAHLLRVMRWIGPVSYVAGGEDVSPGVFGLGKVIALIHGNATDGTLLRSLAYNPATGKLQWFVGTTRALVPGSKWARTTMRLGVWNIATQKLQFIVPNTNAEVAAAVNLSTFTGAIVVFGN